MVEIENGAFLSSGLVNHRTATSTPRSFLACSDEWLHFAEQQHTGQGTEMV
jgi:hypothetical protein